MYKLLNNKFKLFLLVNTPIWAMLTINGWYFVPILVLLAWFLGGYYDGVKEDSIEYHQGRIWNDSIIKNGFIQLRGENNEILKSTKLFEDLAQDPESLDFGFDYKIKIRHREIYWYDITSPVFSHSSGWYFRVHLVYLMAVICVVHFFNLPWYFILLLELSFLQCEIGYYLWAAKFYKRFFPENYNLWGDKETEVITQIRLYIILSVINVINLVLSYII